MLFPLYTNDFVWGLFSQMIFLLFIVCLLVTSIGFYKLVFFISVGYGYSIFGMAIISLLLSRGIGSWTTWIHAILLGIYGLRLGTFVAIREGKATYQTCRANDGDRTGEARLSVQLAIWVSVSVLYVALFEPAAARFEAEARGVVDGKNLLSCAGLAVIAGGLVVESVADHQKAAAKAIAPGRFCDKGLYRIVRCPNYMGELLVWTGNMLAGSPMLANWGQWALATAGYMCLVLIMIGSARRLELKQAARYGDDPAFRAYVARVPILVPFVPIYSLKNAVVYLG